MNARLRRILSATMAFVVVASMAGGAGAVAWMPADADTTAANASSTEAQVMAGTFTVTLLGNNSPVVEGNNLTVTAAIERTDNDGGGQITKTVSLDVSGQGTVESKQVTLNPNENQTRTFNWTTGDGDKGSYTATVSSPDDAASGDVVVEEPAIFSVTIDQTNSPVDEGENLTVDATIENTGDRSGSQTVTLDTNDTGQLDSEGVSLAPGATEQVTLNWTTESGDGGDYTASVSSSNDSKSQFVKVLQPANFSVNITDTNSPVNEGENLTVDATVENVGDESGTQSIDLDIDGANGGGSETVSLAAGGSTSVTLNWTTGLGDAGSYTAYVNSSNDSDSETVTVQQPPTYNVQIDDDNSPVVEGNNLTVTATITNTGSAGDNRTVDLTVDGEVRDETALSLTNGESRTITLTWETREGDDGSYSATVASPDQSKSTPVTVNDSANFSVSIDATNSPVVEGNKLTVEATVENTGEVSDTQNVTLTVNDTVRDSTDVSLGAGSKTTVNLTWTTGDGDGGSYTANVSSANDSAETGVAVNESANFTVSIDSTNEPIGEGEVLTVTATVTNEGEVQDNQSVGLNISGTVGEVDSTPVNLSAGATKTVTLEWTTESGDNGTYTATVSSANDSADRSVTVNQSEFFAVTIDATNEPVVEGETVQVNATVENTGAETGEQTVALEIDGTQKDSTGPLTLTSGETRNVTLEWTTGSGDDGNYTAAVVSENESDSTGVEVQKPADFSVTVVSTNEPVVEGETIQVNATVENTGDVNDTQTVALTIDGNKTDERTDLTLAGGETEQVTLEWTTGDGDDGTYTATVASDDDADSTQVEVQKPAEFSVSIDATNSPVVEGNNLTVEATVTNAGDTTGTKNVTLTVDGTGRDSEELTIPGGESTTTTLTWATAEGDDGNYTATVASPNDSASSSVTVQDSANFSVTITGNNSPVVEGKNLTVDVTVENTGEVEDTQAVTLTVDGTDRDSEDLTIAGGDSTTTTLTWATAEGDDGDYTANVSSANDSDSTPVSVGDSANFSVTIDSTNTPVVEGNNLTVEATVTNTGDVADTQNVTLETVPGVTSFSQNWTERDSKSVSLDPGNSTTVKLNWTTAEGDAGGYNANVSSANTSETRSVTIQDSPNFSVTITGTNSPVTEGEKLEVDVEVVNTGDVEGEQNVTLTVGGEQRDVKEGMNLGGGESETKTLEWETQDGDDGNYTANVSSANDSDSTDVEVQAPANFNVTLDSTNSPVVEGETLQVNATVTNTGDKTDTQKVELKIDGGKEDERKDLTLAGNESEEVTLNWTTEDGDDGTYTATVETDDDTNATEVEVKKPADFTVSIQNTSSPVVEGKNLTVNATITNEGDVNDTQTVNLTADGTVRANDTVTLGPGNSTTVTLTWNTTEGDSSIGSVTVESDDDADSSGVDIKDSANFNPNFDDTNQPVVEGKNLTVEATITNTGEVGDTQNVTLVVGNVTRDNTTVQVDGGNSKTVTLNWSTEEGDAGEYTPTLRTENRTKDRNSPITVLDSANFSVTITGNNSPVVEGKDLTVDVSVENTGDVEDTQNVTLTVGGEQRDLAEDVNLEGGASTTTTLTWSTNETANGTYTANVSSANDSDSTEVTIQQPAFFDVTIDSTNDPVVEGNELTVEATVENTGDVRDSQVVRLFVDGAEQDQSDPVELDGGETGQVTLAWNTSEGDDGEFTAKVESANASDDQSVSVGDSANFTVSIDEDNVSIVEGNELSVEAEVNNTGEVEDTQNVTLAIDGTVRDGQEVTLAGSDSPETVTLTWSTAEGDNGSYTARVESENESKANRDVVGVDVKDSANFSVTVESYDAEVVEGNNLSVTATVTNTGEVNGSQTVTLTINETGEVVDSRDLELAGDESRDVTFVWETEEGDDGNFTGVVESENDSDRNVDRTGNLRVKDSQNFSVTVVGTNDPVVEGKDLTVEATVTNTGEVEGTQTLNLTVPPGGTEEATRELTLGPGESDSVELTWTTEEGDDGNRDFRVASANQSASSSAEVLDSQNFSVTVVDYDREVVAGETVNVTASIDNTGDVGGNQTITLTRAGGLTQEDSTTVNLSAGQRTRVTLSWSTSGERGENELTVSSANDSSTRIVTVQKPGVTDVEIDSTNEPVLEGETMSVTAVVTNRGDLSTRQTINLTVEGEVRDGRTIELAGGERTEVRLTWETEAGDSGGYVANVTSADDTVRRDVTVLAPGATTVTLDSTTSPVVEGETMNFTATVTNTGDEPESQTIELVIGGEVRDDATVTLPGGESETIDLSWNTVPGDAGGYRANVSSENDSARTDVRVDAPSTFAVSFEGSNSPVVEGETMEVEAFVENLGDLEGTETVALVVDGEERDTRELTLDGGENETVTLTWTTGENDGGEHTAEVRAGSNADNETVTVQRPAEFDVEISSADSPVMEGDQLSIVAEISNVGDLERARTVVLSIGGNERDSTDVTVPGGQSREVILTWTPGDGEAGNYTAEVTSGGASDTAPVTVNSPATFEVTVEEFPGSVEVGQQVGAVVLVENVGDQAGNQTITLSKGTTVQDEKAVSLASGETDTVALAWATGDDDRGDHTLYVDSENDSESFNVSVGVAGGGGPGGLTEPPTVEIGYGPESPAPGQTVRFRAQAQDPDGTVEAYQWRINGDPVSRSSSFATTFEESGTYRISVVVTDNRGANAQTTTVVVVNEPPTAEITDAPDTAREGETVTFSGTGSDEDGSVVGYTWEIDGVVVGNEQDLEYTFQASGTYTVTFAVTDDAGATEEVETTVEVTQNAPPEVEIAGETTVETGDSVEYTAQATDADGRIDGYRWFVDGELVGESESIERTFTDPGEHEVRLVVTDEDGAETERSVTVFVNEPPEAELETNVSNATVSVNESITFDAEAVDELGEIVSYEWRIDGEVVDTGETFDYRFEEPGRYEVTLVVTDNNGSTATVTRTIQVEGQEMTMSGDSPVAPGGVEDAIVPILVVLGFLTLLGVYVYVRFRQVTGAGESDSGGS